MRYDNKTGAMVLSTGRRFYGFHDGLLNPHPFPDNVGELVYGYDGYTSMKDESDDNLPFTADERREIADHMIAKWQRWAVIGTTLPHAAGVVIIRNGKIAAIRSKKRGGALEIPGGKGDPEEMPSQTAVRECLEEVGVIPEIIRELYVARVDGDTTYMCWWYLARTELELVSGDEGNACWVTPEELLTGTYAEHTKQWLPLVAEELAAR